MPTLFIADLHLQDERPELTRAFLHFLQRKARQADALYILGDLFEAWVGDDDPGDCGTAVIQGIKQLSDAGVPVYVQHGNRDFLLGQLFAEQSGARLLPEWLIVTPYQRPLLLMHGDQLCLDDQAYQQFRQQVRSDQWQQQFLSKPLAERRAIAQQLRTLSSENNQQKSMAIMDVNTAEVHRVMAEHGSDILIHGHTHRPAIHDLDHHRSRIVLGDWGPAAWYLQWHADDSYELLNYPLSDSFSG